MGDGVVRKKGFARFFEVLAAEYRGLFVLNLLFLTCVLPTVVIFFFSIFGFYSEISLIVSLIAAIPVGGATVAYLFCITVMLRGEPSYIWDDFKRKFKENVKQAATPGILCAAFLYAQVYLWGPLIFGGGGINVVWLIPGGVFLLVFGMVAPYLFLQIAYIDLKTKQIVINSLLISFSNAPRSFMGAVMSGAIWAAFVLLLPVSLIAFPLLLLIGFSFSALISMMWVWPPVDRQFNIEKTLRDKQD